MAEHVVFYHGPNCADGISAAWVVNKYITEQLNQTAELIAVDYHHDLPAIPMDKCIWVVDFTFPDPDFMKELISCNEWMVHFDHHPSAEDTIDYLKSVCHETNYRVKFTQEHSGAGIAWSELFGDYEQPLFIRWVEDRDLWLFRYTETKAFGEAFQLGGYTLDNCDNVSDNSAALAQVSKGKPIVDERLKRCTNQIKHQTTHISLKLHDGLWHAIPFSRLKRPDDASDQTNLMLSMGMGPVVAAYTKKEGKVKVRVTTDADNPVAYQIARVYGGGGHPHTAGFVVASKRLPGLF